MKLFTLFILLITQNISRWLTDHFHQKKLSKYIRPSFCSFEFTSFGSNDLVWSYIFFELFRSCIRLYVRRCIRFYISICIRVCIVFVFAFVFCVRFMLVLYLFRGFALLFVFAFVVVCVFSLYSYLSSAVSSY